MKFKLCLPLKDGMSMKQYFETKESLNNMLSDQYTAEIEYHPTGDIKPVAICIFEKVNQ